MSDFIRELKVNNLFPTWHSELPFTNCNSVSWEYWGIGNSSGRCLVQDDRDSGDESSIVSFDASETQSSDSDETEAEDAVALINVVCWIVPKFWSSAVEFRLKKSLPKSWSMYCSFKLHFNPNVLLIVPIRSFYETGAFSTLWFSFFFFKEKLFFRHSHY